MTVIIFIVTVILVPVVVGEFVDWLPWVGTRLIRHAARRLPLQYRARYEEESQAAFYSGVLDHSAYSASSAATARLAALGSK